MAVPQLLGFIALCVTAVGAKPNDCFVASNKCPNEKITFWLRTEAMGKKRLVITNENVHEMKPGDHPDSQLKVIILGFKGYQDNNKPSKDLVKEYLKLKIHNILIVDWGQMAKEGCYEEAKDNTRVAGTCTAKLLEQFYAVSGEKWKRNTHIIGFGLGAHVAGVVGYHVKHLGRITGLDPNREGFKRRTSRKFRLDPSDAFFVDVYHTNSGEIGKESVMGTVDFYFNNGKSQPGCETPKCSHLRSMEIFVESINRTKAFLGQTCKLPLKAQHSKEICPFAKNYYIAVAGEFVIEGQEGKFKIETYNESPYGKGEDGVKNSEHYYKKLVDSKEV